MSKLKTLLLLAPLAAPLAATANEAPYSSLVLGGNRMEEQDVKRNGATLFTNNLKDGYYAGLTFGQTFGTGLRPELELGYRYNDFSERREVQPANTVTVDGFGDAITLMANLWFEISMDNGPFYFVHPYIGGGGGGARLAVHHPTIDNDEGPGSFDVVLAWQLGAGFAVDLSNKTALTFDYRHLLTQEGSFKAENGDDVQARYEADTVMLGFRVSYGSYPEAPDYHQPVRIVPVAAGAPQQDLDGDGVPDMDDRCPSTPQGFQVDAAGCIAKQSLVLRDINFETNSARLTASSGGPLATVGKALSTQPGLRIDIAGHTDSVGSEKANQKLSQARAESVLRYLVDHGAPAERLTARGLGESAPVADNNTEAGRAENRRVEFVIRDSSGE